VSHPDRPRSKPSLQPGEAIARVLAARGVRCDRERAAAVADFLLSLVERGVLVSAEDPIVNNMGSAIHRDPGEAV